MRYDRERATAVNAVRIASILCRTIQADMIGDSTIYKGDKSPVTVADYSAQALICSLVKKAFPNDPIIAEEDSSFLVEPENAFHLECVQKYLDKVLPGIEPDDILSSIDLGNGDVGGRYWTLDPIDGTKGFIRGDQYAVALALIEEGEVKVGVLGCPNFPLYGSGSGSENGALFVAVKGEGAEISSLRADSKRAIKVSNISGPLDARMVEGVDAGHSNHEMQSKISRLIGIQKDSVRLDSQVKYGAVARGDAEVYLRLQSPKTPDYREKIWDHAAGVLVVEEAGGRVTDTKGQPLDFTKGKTLSANSGVVVSNGLFHDELIVAIGKLSRHKAS